MATALLIGLAGGLLLFMMHAISRKDRDAEKALLELLITARTIQSLTYSIQKNHPAIVEDHLPRAVSSAMAAVEKLLSTGATGRLHLLSMRSYATMVGKALRETFRRYQDESSSALELLLKLVEHFSDANARVFVSALNRRYVASGGAVLDLASEAEETTKAALESFALAELVGKRRLLPRDAFQ